MAQVRNVLRGIAHALVEPPAAVLHALDRAMRDLAVGALAVLAVSTGLHTLRVLAASPAPEDVVLGAALTSGRALALAGGLGAVLVVMALLRGVEPGPPTTPPPDPAR